MLPYCLVAILQLLKIGHLEQTAKYQTFTFAFPPSRFFCFSFPFSPFARHLLDFISMGKVFAIKSHGS